ncbi:hypothetical protein A2890_01340 [candidate division WWE3 bacterium RIFCSPLOWO2_01_FULL_53_14]|uniref:Uncharacterized protein n=1 Tax=candidate division WWE3 bacterium RIFCSPLOWO2_01_FULL_53_14 TaxID=1802628 RepID=A0A1F4VZ70_UNCKA|nr:MAG: hypothetical protein A2890_01340 [candidate division WWE3 bacterium RIFCSPLOWO2_01_FULL_53_14]
MAQHQWGERNLAEQATLLALAFRAGRANREEGDRFFVQPADVGLDLGIGTDLFLFRNRRFLRVDVTDSREQKPLKIRRTVKKAREGKGWVYILKVEWNEAAFITTDPCFTKAYDQSIRDGQMLAIERACPNHGNECNLARKLWSFGNSINYALVSSSTQARFFAIPVSRPPF